MKRFLAAFLALPFACVAISSACLAAPNEQLVRVVTYSDEDLSSPNRVAALHRRIERAINQVCADPSGPSPAVVVDPSCKADAWGNVRAQMETAVTSLERKGRTALLIGVSARGIAAPKPATR
jgi:UrcA family protein